MTSVDVDDYEATTASVEAVAATPFTCGVSNTKLLNKAIPKAW
ncbi:MULTISPECIES: hypothetical protein [Streptococcus]|nr:MULTISPECIES: hypothetical protein [Streptococcus]